MAKVFTLDERAWKDSIGRVSVLVGEGLSKTLTAGLVVLEPGQRLPEKGYSQHSESDELAYVVEGYAFFGKEDGEEVMIRESDLLFNPKGTRHYVRNPGDKPCKMIWALAPSIKL